MPLFEFIFTTLAAVFRIDHMSDGGKILEGQSQKFRLHIMLTSVRMRAEEVVLCCQMLNTF